LSLPNISSRHAIRIAPRGAEIHELASESRMRLRQSRSHGESQSPDIAGSKLRVVDASGIFRARIPRCLPRAGQLQSCADSISDGPARFFLQARPERQVFDQLLPAPEGFEPD